MPVYSFRCRKCERLRTFIHGMDEPHPETCGDVTIDCEGIHVCDGELDRVFDAPSVIYRGSGFYQTDKALYPKQDDDL